MIRPFTAVCTMLAAGSMLYVYQTKHQGQLLDKKIESTIKATAAVRERISTLQNEWAKLNQPERLMDLSRDRLALATTPQHQLVPLGDLAAHLPAPLPPGTAQMPEDVPVAVASPTLLPPSAPAALASAAAPNRPAVSARAAVATAPRPVQTAAAQPAAAPTAATLPPATPTAQAAPSRVATRTAGRPAEHELPQPPQEHAAPERAQLAQALAVPAPVPPRPQAVAEVLPPIPPAPRPRILAPVVTAVAPPIPAPAGGRHPTGPAAPVVTNVAAPAAVAAGYGSVLGGVRSAPLPAPVPFSQASR